MNQEEGDLANAYRCTHGSDAPERYCQVNEKLVDRPPRYWARASREPAMLGIKNGRRPQLDNTAAALKFQQSVGHPLARAQGQDSSC